MNPDLELALPNPREQESTRRERESSPILDEPSLCGNTYIRLTMKLGFPSGGNPISYSIFF